MSRSACRALALLVLAGTGFVAPRAFAAPPDSPPEDDATPVELSWVRLPEAADCPPAEDVRADVERRLGRPLLPERRSSGGEGRRAVSIEVLVSRKTEGFRADIEMRATDGTSVGSRVVSSDSPTCASLGAAAALTVSIMLRPLLAPPEAPDPPAQTPPPASPPPRVVEPPPVAAPEAPTPHHPIGFSLGVVGASGVLPKLSLGLESAAEAGVSAAWGVRAHVAWLPARRIQRPEGTMSFGATIVGAGACYEPTLLDGMRLRACAGPFAQALGIAVERPDAVGDAWHWTWGARVGAELGWALGPVGVALGAHALVPWSRRDYLVRHAAPAPPTSFFRQPPSSGLLFLGLRMPAAER